MTAVSAAGRLRDRTTIITGASRGIGRAIALRFAAEGARVGLIARTEADLVEVARACTAAGARAAIAVADVADPAQVGHAATILRRELGPADVVVNNAGAIVRKPALELTDAEWHRVIAVNLDGTFFVTRAFGADLRARKGRVINIASIAGRQGTPLLAAYCAAKHAVVGFTRALAEELRGSEVTVNAICPGSVDTEMLRQGLPGTPPAMTPDDIAATAMFLAADAPTALTGSCLDVFG
jgi:NAD(P)-dependent dehydrogenase (short-subunit alcohol dehydrogenase family)